MAVLPGEAPHNPVLERRFKMRFRRRRRSFRGGRRSRRRHIMSRRRRRRGARALRIGYRF